MSKPVGQCGRCGLCGIKTSVFHDADSQCVSALMHRVAGQVEELAGLRAQNQEQAEQISARDITLGALHTQIGGMEGELAEAAIQLSGHVDIITEHEMTIAELREQLAEAVEREKGLREALQPIAKFWKAFQEYCHTSRIRELPWQSTVGAEITLAQMDSICKALAGPSGGVAGKD